MLIVWRAPDVDGCPAKYVGGAVSIADAPVVATVSVALPLLLPSSVTAVGETAHVEYCGAPAQESVTFCAKAPSGDKVRE